MNLYKETGVYQSSVHKLLPLQISYFSGLLVPLIDNLPPKATSPVRMKGSITQGSEWQSHELVEIIIEVGLQPAHISTTQSHILGCW